MEEDEVVHRIQDSRQLFEGFPDLGLPLFPLADVTKHCNEPGRIVLGPLILQDRTRDLDRFYLTGFRHAREIVSPARAVGSDMREELVSEPIDVLWMEFDEIDFQQFLAVVPEHLNSGRISIDNRLGVKVDDQNRVVTVPEYLLVPLRPGGVTRCCNLGLGSRIGCIVHGE